MVRKEAQAALDIDQEQARRARLIQTMIFISVAAVSSILVLFAVLLAFALTPRLPAIYMSINISVFILLSGFSFWLVRRDKTDAAKSVYLVALVAALTIAIFLANGATGPIAVGLVMATVIAGLVGGLRSLGLVAFFSGILYLIMLVLEATGVLQPIRVSQTVEWVVEGVLFIVFLDMTALAAGAFVSQSQRAISAAQQRERELVEIGHQAEQAALAEREVRQREARSAAHLRETVAGYTDYLARVAAGDYEARVDVGVLDEQVEGDRELHALGEYLNSTVDALVAALADMQTVQRRYTAQSWEAFVQSARVQQGFRYVQDRLLSDDDAWLPEMKRAATDGTVVVSEDSVAVPLIVNRQVIGTIGGRRPGGRAWTEEELALIREVTGQLAQTIESLRLLDETQRSAAREQVIGEVTGRVRETLDMETMLKAATSEIRRAIGLDKVVVRLADPGHIPGKPTGS